VFIDRYPKEKQEWYENDTNEFCRSASPYGSLTPNSIESTVVLKQPDKLSVVYDRSSGGCLCSPYNGPSHGKA
jgi:hypothetical protein